MTGSTSEMRRIRQIAANPAPKLAAAGLATLCYGVYADFNRGLRVAVYTQLSINLLHESLSGTPDEGKRISWRASLPRVGEVFPEATFLSFP